MDPDQLALGPLWYIAFLFSTTCHEASHALVAKLGGDPTAHHGGQVSLNPIPHIRREPFGLVVIPILSFLVGGGMIGWASAPYDPYWRHRHPRRAAFMSLAGPAANFTLMLLAGFALRLGLATGFFRMGGSFAMSQLVQPATGGFGEALAVLLSIIFTLNLLLGCFNLLPIPPLDGYGVLGIFVTEDMARKLTEWQYSARAFTMIGLLVGWQIFDQIYPPILLTALQTLFWGVTS